VTALLFAVICLIWGSTWLAIKVGLDGVPPFLGAGLRFLLSTLIVGAMLVVRRKAIRLTRNDRICVLSLAIPVFWINYGAVYWAEQHISSGLAAVLFSTMPLMTALLSRFWARSEKLSARKILGILIGVAGTVLLFWPDERLGPQQVLGMAATLVACLCASMNLVTMKLYGGRSDRDVLNFLGMGLGAALLLLTSVVLEPWSVDWTRRNVTAMLYLAVFGSVIAFSAYYALIKLIDATIVSLSTLIIPIIALILGGLVLGETVGPTAIAGIVTVLIGVAVSMVPGQWVHGRWSSARHTEV
jgi:drug/metabolite transporter (DMT)-like permease